MLRGILGGSLLIGNSFITFETDSGETLDPAFIATSATFEWISPDESVSTGVIPNPVLDQTGLYTIKCTDWSNVTDFVIDNDNLIILHNLVLLPSITNLQCQTNRLETLDISALSSLISLDCSNNRIDTLDLATLTELTTLYVHDNGMNQANVDKILRNLMLMRVYNGTCRIDGTNAAPSMGGLASKIVLETRGWTVTVSI